ncbi:MAG: RHS repeat-associated core domain-containing protein [Sphingobacteriaceae bacterium]|nr:RHS repeat-associated core domain-containing protein [Sphingobacteriaceae bacterium]
MKKITKYLTAFFLLSGVISYGLKAQEAKIVNAYNPLQPNITASGSITLVPGFFVPQGNSFRAYISGISQSQPFAAQPSANRTYGSIKIFKIPGIKTAGQANQQNFLTNQVSQVIEYQDGLGRPVQQVALYASPTGKDVVHPIAYDNAGRQPKQYLAYTKANNQGQYNAQALDGGSGYASGEQYNFYQSGSTGNFKSTTFPYAEARLDPLGLNQTEQGSVGAIHQLAGGHTTKTNLTLSTTADGVLNWQLTSNGLSASGNNVLEGLIKEIAKDANWVAGRAGTKESFTDGNGRRMADRFFITENQSATTYYVYDQIKPDRLLYILSPGFNAQQIVLGDSTFNRYVYAYRYDQRNRTIAKKIPGAGWLHIVYNQLDQPVATQDSVQRIANEWSYVKYDVQGRIILNGKYATTADRINLQAQLDAAVNNWEKRDVNGTYGYSNVSFPTGNSTEVYKVIYYDDYDLPSSCPFATAPAGSTSIVTGLPTASLTRVLDTQKMLWTVNYYDEDGQPIKVYAENNINGTDELTNTYAFTGQLESAQRISTTANSTVSIGERYVYDDSGRLLQTWEKINNQPEVLLSEMVYNELGQVAQKKLHSVDGTSFLQTQSYSYNDQGALKTINSADITGGGNAKFGMELKYEDAAIPQYNGNIGASQWKVARTGTSPKMGYDYQFDAVGRIVAAESLTNGNKDKNYSEYIKYDQLGNIRDLGRYANINGVRTQIDSLNYQYQGGRHTRIDDATGNPLGFSEEIQTDDEYGYDGFGRVISDKNKNITIAYNAVSLPKLITWPGTGRTTEYTYSADGTKLGWQHTVNGTSEGKLYNSGLEYAVVNGGAPVLKFIQTSEGRARFNGTAFVYEYYLTDNLGNVRATIDADPADPTQLTARVLQEHSYYPFGATMPGADINFASGEANSYLYNGKELDAELNQYDSEARFYDATIGRWSAIDPMSEKYFGISAYSYVFNNPLMFIDPSGMDPEGPGGGYVLVEPGLWFNKEKNEYFAYTYSGPDGSAAAAFAEHQAFFGGTFFGAMNEMAGWKTYSLMETPQQRKAREQAAERAALRARNEAIYNAKAKQGNFGTNAKQGNKEIDWYGPGGKMNWILGVSALASEKFSGISRVGNNLIIYNATRTGRVFYANQYVNTFGLSKVGGLLGKVSFGIGVVIDGVGVYNYYKNPKSVNAVSPGKFGLNTGVGAFGLTGVGTIPAITYFGIDAFYPGGIQGYANDYKKVLDNNPGYYPHFSF